MAELISQLTLFGTFLSVLAYLIGLWVNRITKLSVLSPFLVAVFLVIGFLVFFRIDYAIYAESIGFLTYLLTPATVCLAIPLYQRLDLLRREWKAILAGIFTGVLCNCVGILALVRLFGLGHLEYVTLLPKSVTTAISIGLSNELGGLVTVTIAATIISGVTGNMLAPLLCRLFFLRSPVARGVAIGTASHAIGTARAMEMGPTEGGMSGLSIAVTGMLTVIIAPIFAALF